MRQFTRRRAAALATAAALAAVGTLAGAPGAAADAGPWPGTEGKILTDGPTLVDPATGTATQVGTHMGNYAAWAPDGSRRNPLPSRLRQRSSADLAVTVAVRPC
ncbi:hypothetical protein SAMN06272735_9275 [Streptomyces sp. TLI_55]|uniref:hypothetical protein n=1 Tax=Streptomyces sp. TLI_55 TaxID=1938861 RepID=UPI000BD67B71|nr:hypothetical protein [Streptomyces sp. TLI_55]SNX88769.1 hypothetical protein SAMN06272735_9275 [Streptomyces sp. TLI_55]